MADEQSTAPVTDEIADDGVDLEDTDVSFDDFEDTQEQEEAEAETTTEEDESDTETDDEAEEDTEEASKEDTTDTESTELSEEEQQKAFNKQMAEKRIQEKAIRDNSIKQKQDEYLNEAEDDKDLALRQLQIDAYDNKIERNTNTLKNSYDRAVIDFPILSDKTPEVQEFISQAVDDFERMNITLDAYGNPSDVKADFYQYLQNKADAISKLSGIGAKQQGKSKGKEKSKTFTTPSRAPKEGKRDADLDAFDEEANRW